ncbi:fibronectin type III domain-containing protein [Candidatus Peregrinibacteria bacterium]|nr:fibronectin type III domain-containing protein [Candidatus Peregrinibacteria bacterium]
MVKNLTLNKRLFYLIVALTALFLCLNFVPGAYAQAGDTTPPDDVENLQVQTYDGAAYLTWDVATDDVKVTGYKLYSGPEPVTALSGEYSNPVIDVGDTISFLLTGLENGKTVYFAITAYDAAGNESDSYSNEANATPDPSYGEAPDALLHSASDEDAPTVSDAQALDNITVKIVFSEAVVIPGDAPETAFTIINNATSELLAVKAVKMDDDDVLGRTVLLTTDPQQGGSEYILTAGIQIEDTGGNPIVSGTSDTAAFIGSTVEPGQDLMGDLPEEDVTPPRLESAESAGKNKIIVTFSEPVILSSDPETNFTIRPESSPLTVLEITGVEKDSTGLMVTLTTDDQASETYELLVSGIIDEAGNEIASNANTVTFEGNYVAAVAPPDETGDDAPSLTPQNVKNLIASIVRELVIKLTWSTPDDESIVDQILYKSIDGGKNYDTGTSLGADREEVELTGLTPGSEYYFKLTTKNQEGVESTGVVTHIRLAETGMGLGLLIGASMGLAALKNKKKK